MAQNYIQQGDVLEWVNSSGSDVQSGQVVVAGEFVGVATGNIPDGQEGRIALSGVWELPKASGLAMAQGDRVYWDVADGNLNKTPADNHDTGLVFRNAETDDDRVQVKLGA